jgi:hypothetical protein
MKWVLHPKVWMIASIRPIVLSVSHSSVTRCAILLFSCGICKRSDRNGKGNIFIFLGVISHVKNERRSEEEDVTPCYSTK